MKLQIKYSLQILESINVQNMLGKIKKTGITGLNQVLCGHRASYIHVNFTWASPRIIWYSKLRESTYKCMMINWSRWVPNTVGAALSWNMLMKCKSFTIYSFINHRLIMDKAYQKATFIHHLHNAVKVFFFWGLTFHYLWFHPNNLTFKHNPYPEAVSTQCSGTDTELNTDRAHRETMKNIIYSRFFEICSQLYFFSLCSGLNVPKWFWSSSIN